MTTGVFVIGSGTSVPNRIVTNEELSAPLGLEAEQIYKSSGIRRRHWADKGTTTSSLAVEALQRALDRAQLKPEEIDYVLFGTMTPDRFVPGSAPSLQTKLRLPEIPCLDIRATCCNALYGLQNAAALVKSGMAHNIAVCLAEIQSAWLDLSKESGTISMLFGDGASALIVSDKETDGALRYVDTVLATNGEYVDDLGVRCPGTESGNALTNAGQLNARDFMPRMVGQSVILQASRRMVTACNAVIERNQITIGEIRWIVPHQANANLLAQVARSLRFDTSKEGVVSVLEEYGNTSSASMGIALDTLLRSNRIQPRDYLLLPAFGAGFTWGAGLLKAV